VVPTREIFWNVGNLQTVVYLFAFVAIVIATYGTARHLRRWSLGKREKRLDQPIKRLQYLVQSVFGQGQILREPYAGIMHLLIFWGFFVLFLGTLTIALQEDVLVPFFNKKVLLGNFYLFYSLMLDLFGLLATVGILLSFYRRYITRPRGLDNKPSDVISLSLILFILITGFCVEGLRIAVSQPPWAPWEPVGWFLGKIFTAAGYEEIQGKLHKFFWWIHLTTSMGFIAYFPFSNLFHILSSSLNVFFRSLKPRGFLAPLDFCQGQPFGAARIQDFTWKDLLDLDACTRCGRCQENCPAYLSDKPLNPKKVILDLRTFLHASHSENRGLKLVRSCISEEELWACTTCHACIEVCPVFVQHVEKIINLRRHLVLEEAKFPSEVKSVFRNIEIYGDTRGRGPSYRSDWASGLFVERAGEDSSSDILYWAGCEGSFHDRNKEVSKVIVRMIQEAGVSVGILGKEEVCCGDPARRIGNEYLFQELALRNIDTLNRYGVKKIITYCPHCYNTLKNEYPQFGGHFDVVHYSVYLNELLRQGRLKVKRPLEGRVTFHDPCYLGRVNGIYDAPREILQCIPALESKELNLSREKSFCCGAGGGRMWMHEHLGQRINNIRAKEVIEAGVDLVATSCPYCLTMVEEGIQGREMEKQVSVLDLAEILYRSVELSRRIE
jgi:Fe-S oxidoreductase/nitrate reductase gamma subunit